MAAQQFVINMLTVTVHRESNKQDTKLLPITLPNIGRFCKILSLLDSLENL